MASLRKVESQQEEGKYDQQDGVDQPGQSFEEPMYGPKLQGAVQFLAVSQAEPAAGEETRVGAKSKRQISGAHRQSQIGNRGIQLQVVDARDLLITLRIVAVRPLGLDELAVGKDFRTERVDSHGCVLADRQFDKQSDRSVVWSQLDVEPKPGEGGLMALWPVRVLVPFWRASRMVLVRHVGKGLLRVPEGPS